MPSKKSFKTLMTAIEAITQQLEQEQTDLEASLELFREGQTLIKEAKTKLHKLEHKFHLIHPNDDTLTDNG